MKLAGKIREIEVDPEKFLVNQIDYTIFFLNCKKEKRKSRTKIQFGIGGKKKIRGIEVDPDDFLVN